LTEKQSAVNKLIKPVSNVDSSMNKQVFVYCFIFYF